LSCAKLLADYAHPSGLVAVGDGFLAIKDLYSSLFLELPKVSEICSPGSIVRSSIGGCRPPDPGSNPGQGAFSI